MPSKNAIERARRDKRAGKSPSTQAGEFVREEMHHIRIGKHGARSTKQAIAIGLSEARRAGVKLPPPRRGAASKRTRAKAKREYRQGQARPGRRLSPKRSAAALGALRRERRGAASHKALSRQARNSARRRGFAARSNAARKAAGTRKKRGSRK